MIILSQECKTYFLHEEDKVVEMSTYTGDHDFTGKVRNMVYSRKEKENGFELQVENEVFNKKGDAEYKGNYTVKCENGNFYLDMESLIDPEMLKTKNSSMTVEIEADQLLYPSDMKEGQMLPDGFMTVKMMVGTTVAMKMTINVTNRKVEGFEKMNTPAGTFDCFKITYTVNSKTMMVNNMTNVTEYLSEGVGAVKTENRNKSGKLVSYSQLTKIE